QRNYGVELETAFRPTDAWRIGLNVAYLNAEFQKFSKANKYIQVGFGVWAPVPQPADGTVAPRSPEWSGNLSTSYDIDVSAGTIQLAANVAANTKFYHYVNEQREEPGYGTVDLNASFTTRDTHWRGEVFVTNLNDHHRHAQLATGPTGTVALWGPPRT